MLTVSLCGARFTAPVGLYPQELLLGNELEIHLSVRQETPTEQLPLIDYEVLYQIVSEEIKVPETLLEYLIQRIVAAISAKYPDVAVSLAIRKLHPPFGGRVAYAEVKWESGVPATSG